MRKKALLALLLLVPAASFGVTMALWIFPGRLGQTLFSFSKIWLFVLPTIWYLKVENGQLKLTPPKLTEILLGIALGMAMLAAIVGAYGLLGSAWIEPTSVRNKAREIGLVSPQIYWAGAAYFSLINAPIEEYVWRWFVGRQCEFLVPARGAIVVSAVLFTLHHIIGLAAYFEGKVIFLGGLGVGVAGAIWSWCYFRDRSLWASTISHILADLGIAIVGWNILFSR